VNKISSQEWQIISTKTRFFGFLVLSNTSTIFNVVSSKTNNKRKKYTGGFV
jgi:hypothetical protein